ncbi:hypothetical protein F5Y14DRAFT_456495 [Nemania sp. NC0429]|nr:hypothetical protein F5Y14DRAFT_456495 [Nemania sp. NC0429]
MSEPTTSSGDSGGAQEPAPASNPVTSDNPAPSGTSSAQKAPSISSPADAALPVGDPVSKQRRKKTQNPNRRHLTSYEKVLGPGTKLAYHRYHILDGLQIDWSYPETTTDERKRAQSEEADEELTGGKKVKLSATTEQEDSCDKVSGGSVLRPSLPTLKSLSLSNPIKPAGRDGTSSFNNAEQSSQKASAPQATVPGNTSGFLDGSFYIRPEDRRFPKYLPKLELNNNNNNNAGGLPTAYLSHQNETLELKPIHDKQGAYKPNKHGCLTRGQSRKLAQDALRDQVAKQQAAFRIRVREQALQPTGHQTSSAAGVVRDRPGADGFSYSFRSVASHTFHYAGDKKITKTFQVTWNCAAFPFVFEAKTVHMLLEGGGGMALTSQLGDDTDNCAANLYELACIKALLKGSEKWSEPWVIYNAAEFENQWEMLIHFIQLWYSDDQVCDEKQKSGRLGALAMLEGSCTMESMRRSLPPQSFWVFWAEGMRRALQGPPPPKDADLLFLYCGD